MMILFLMEMYLHAFLENKFLGEISLCSQNIISLTFHMRKRFWQELGKQCKIKAETNIPQKTFLVTLVFVHFGYLLPLQFDCLFVCLFFPEVQCTTTAVILKEAVWFIAIS